MMLGVSPFRLFNHENVKLHREAPRTRSRIATNGAWQVTADAIQLQIDDFVSRNVLRKPLHPFTIPLVSKIQATEYLLRGLSWEDCTDPSTNDPSNGVSFERI